MHVEERATSRPGHERSRIFTEQAISRLFHISVYLFFSSQGARSVVLDSQSWWWATLYNLP